jgi:hypothetical protein
MNRDISLAVAIHQNGSPNIGGEYQVHSNGGRRMLNSLGFGLPRQIRFIGYSCLDPVTILAMVL